MLLPGESISKYNRADGEAPAPAPAAESGAAEESDRGYGRSRDRVIATVVDVDAAGNVTETVDVAANVNANRASRRASALPQNYTPMVFAGRVDFEVSRHRAIVCSWSRWKRLFHRADCRPPNLPEAVCGTPEHAAP